MASHRHYLIVDPSLLGREFGCVDIWQASHAASFLLYDRWNNQSNISLILWTSATSGKSLMFLCNLESCQCHIGLPFVLENLLRMSSPIDYSGSLHNSSAQK